MPVHLSAGFREWIFVTIIWIIGTAAISYIEIPDKVRSWKWQYVHEMRKEVDTKELDLARPYYENMLSPSAEKLAVDFSELGDEYVEVWDKSVKEGGMVIVSQPDRSLLYLPTALTNEDQQYISDAFWNQRWWRYAKIGKFWAAVAVLPPAALFIVGWALLRVARGFGSA